MKFSANIDVPGVETKAALEETGLSMLGLNTRRGNVAIGENGLAALPGREADARSAIDEAIAYAAVTSATAMHVMAGSSSGPPARQAFRDNLAYTCDAAGDAVTILIEPLNHYNTPGYFLYSTSRADIIREVGRYNLQIVFDFYHVQIMEGDASQRFESLLPLIGHVQVASVPDRAKPDRGELDYLYVLERIKTLGWRGRVGAEYVAETAADPDMHWLTRYRSTL